MAILCNLASSSTGHYICMLAIAIASQLHILLKCEYIYNADMLIGYPNIANPVTGAQLAGPLQLTAIDIVIRIS